MPKNVAALKRSRIRVRRLGAPATLAPCASATCFHDREAETGDRQDGAVAGAVEAKAWAGPLSDPGPW